MSFYLIVSYFYVKDGVILCFAVFWDKYIVSIINILFVMV